jgi:Na+/proline symporter
LPQIFVRFIALKNEREINRGAAVAFVWTVMADSGAVLTGMIGRAMLTEPGQDAEAVLGVAGESVLPMTVEALFPLFIVGIYVAIVLSAIMSTVDSLLVLAGSAAVRDVYQKVLHPEIPGSKLMSKSRQVTIGLALAALLISVGVALVSPDRTVYWFVIFGWSGISATFCPVMILSLFWKGLTARGALFAMITGFLCVPLFKFGAPLLPGVGPYFAELAELPPAFLISMTVAIVVSKFDPAGQARLADIQLP